MDVSEILADIDDHGFGDITSTRKVEVLNQVHWDICGREAWPFLETSATLNFTGSSATASNFPADFSKMLRVYRTLDGARVEPMRMDDILDRYSSSLSTVADPLSYYREGNSIKFWPIPPAGTGTVTIKYVNVPVELTAGSLEAVIALPGRYHRGVLVNGSLVKLYLMQDDPELAQVFKAEFEGAVANMHQDLWSWQFDRPDYIHIADDDQAYGWS